MKTPPLLVGAGLLFWGWQTDFLLAGAIMAVMLESARFVKTRWELSHEDFSRVWTFCAVLFLASGVYAFTSSDGPATVGRLLAGQRVIVNNALGNASVKTSVLLIRWLPMVFFLFVAAQAFSHQEGVPLETISLILQRRWKLAKKSGLPMPESRMVNVGYAYLIVCLFAASSHPVADNHYFFWGLCGLAAWASWLLRSPRFGWVVWACTMAVAILAAYQGQRSMLALKGVTERFNPQWLAGLIRGRTGPLESRTEIGRIGRVKTSRQIVIRLETPVGGAPPAYLREACFRIYNLAVWYAGSSRDDFRSVSEAPQNSRRWPLVSDKTNTATLNIASYLPGGMALLPLPEDAGRLEDLPAYILERNSVGAVRAQGPGLVIFNALYGSGPVIDAAPDTNQDLSVPEKEKAALDAVIAEKHLKGATTEKTLENVSRFFGMEFTYSLWQEQPSTKDASTKLGRFLLTTHSGHCEYFGTATVLLLRRLGIPARYTVGYAVHEKSGANNYVVRQSDAHAWCREWNDARQRWEDFDTTPSSWLETEQEHRSAFQFLFDGWSRLVFEFSKFRWGQSHVREYLLWSLVPVLALLLYQILFRGGKRRLGKDSKSDSGQPIRPGLDSELYALEGELAKRGLGRHSSEPLPVWLDRIGKEAKEPGSYGSSGFARFPGFSNLEQALGQAIALHYRYRFDPQGLNAEDREELRRTVAVCLTSIGGA